MNTFVQHDPETPDKSRDESQPLPDGVTYTRPEPLQDGWRVYIVETTGDGDTNDPYLVETLRSPKEFWEKTIPGFLDVDIWEIARPPKLGGDFDLDLFWDWRYDLNGLPSDEEWAKRPDGVISHWQSTIDFVQRR